MEDTSIVEAEKERQIQLLHKNVEGLKANLAKMEVLTAVKVRGHRSDNEYLLQEVNRMRHEVCMYTTIVQQMMTITISSHIIDL